MAVVAVLLLLLLHLALRHKRLVKLLRKRSFGDMQMLVDHLNGRSTLIESLRLARGETAGRAIAARTGRERSLATTPGLRSQVLFPELESSQTRIALTSSALASPSGSELSELTLPERPAVGRYVGGGD